MKFRIAINAMLLFVLSYQIPVSMLNRGSSKCLGAVKQHGSVLHHKFAYRVNCLVESELSTMYDYRA